MTISEPKRAVIPDHATRFSQWRALYAKLAALPVGLSIDVEDAADCGLDLANPKDARTLANRVGKWAGAKKMIFRTGYLPEEKALRILKISGPVIPEHATEPTQAVEDVIAYLCDGYDVTRAALLGTSKPDALVVPRHLLFWVGVHVLGIPTKRLGGMLGFDHGSILHGASSMRNRAATNDSLRETMEVLAQRFAPAPKPAERELIPADAQSSSSSSSIPCTSTGDEEVEEDEDEERKLAAA